MKQGYLRVILLFALFFTRGVSALAQSDPEGAHFYNAINAGTLSPGVPFSDTRNNSTYNGYVNDMGQPSDDIFYTFTLSSNAEVSISHCASAFDTYMYLFDASGTLMVSNDDNGPLCSTLQSSIKIQLPAGMYYASLRRATTPTAVI